MTFQGFPDEGLVFYEGLEADNSKTYWTRHRAAYDSCVRAPMQALVDALAAEFGPAKLFRPYRDVRFSNDKTPYKTHQGAVAHQEGRGAGACYVEISAEGLRVAGGAWRLESDQVERYRRAVADDVQGPRLRSEVDRLAATGWDIGGDRLTRVPKGYDVDDGRADLLRHRSLHAGRLFEFADWLHGPEALDRVRASWRDLTALNAWLADNVGATTKEIRRR
ncbi:DUF2461 domain-containing protein [Geodermatophilus normandii]|uniref:DUF2461 domain-containing protein n=1 Tax=Geodermatophilus normandii TaxID=1137989 RepID=A0A6P0GLK7_9ACTN|nr:DUF2461 domain-containing protein [Geodermatophilus normandii]NEM08265.1 DUF2461 domain-containing protein [Geodermatophilus normandii]